MSQDKLPLVVIACQVFQGLLEKYLPQEVADNIHFLNYGLHSTPKKLKIALQEAIDALPQPSLVMLAYGLCGNGLDGIQAGRHILLAPRADDCIAIFIGSYAGYREIFDASPGTYYLTKGWLESGSNPLQEYHKYEQKYGAEKASWVMDQQYQHYRRLIFVAHNQEDLERYRPQAQDVAAYCARWGMEYSELMGSDQFVRQLVETAAALEQAGEDFIVVPPGGELRQGRYIR
ncbi:MAG: DUF1638 domain-containing protein [Chloroflexi bacterium]|nr:DUF1638 domain-containing protein [Chloroflexota bacterium]